MTVLSILTELEREPGRKAKAEIIRRHKNNPVFQQTLFMALDPYLTFFVKKVPVPDTHTSVTTLEDALEQLIQLSDRVVTGHAALAFLKDLLESVSADDAEVLRRVVIKDLRCGVQSSTVNDVIPDIIPTYPCLLGKAFDEKSIKAIKYPAISQIKADGMRVNIFVNADKRTVVIRGRSGREVDLKGAMDNTFNSIMDFWGTGEYVFDGEMIIVDRDNKPLPRKIGNGILNKAIKGTISEKEAAGAYINIWDIIPVEDFHAGVCNTPYATRFEQARKVVNSCPGNKYGIIESKEVESYEAAQQHFDWAIQQGHEGIMLKNTHAPWEDRRSPHLVKFKAEKECELKVVGYNPGTPGTKREGKVGSLICESADAKVRVSISGFGDDLLDEITANIDTWVGKVVTVMYNERITSADKNRESVDSLFLPRFVTLREDKFEADSSDQIK